jgi:hypothetical protein
MNNFLNTFPDSKILLSIYPDVEILEVNAHLHTPYSFSAFTSIDQIFSQTSEENIAVAGINDFFITHGYEPFYNGALKARVFPLFNIEFIGLLKQEQLQGIRVNDPNNPGRCYFSGKGLNYPFHIDEKLKQKLNRVIDQSQDQVRAMVDKANNYFQSVNAGIHLDFNEIRINYAKELVRERHIAKAIRADIFEKTQDVSIRKRLIANIFVGREPASALTDIPGLENEIRGVLLKAGGKAFVEEDESAFLSIEELIEIINNAGGIPCYPVLLDDKNGNYTEYERDPEQLWKNLTNRNIGCIELIPGRNDIRHLEKFTDFFNKKGFVILLGTEHNTPDLIPLTCNTRGNKPLSDELRRLSYEGACVVAAHQYLRAKNQEGFIGDNRLPRNSEKKSFISLGNAVIHYFKDYYNR